MRSMTGYGHGQVAHSGIQFSVELNSVNRKQTDVVITLPRELAELEPRIRDQINARISRGRLNLVIACHRSNTSAASVLDVQLAKTYYSAMRELQSELGASGEISIDTILRAPGVIRTDADALPAEEAWPFVEKALIIALDELIEMRGREGRHLAADLSERLQTVTEATARIRQLQPQVIERYRLNLAERLKLAGIQIPIEEDRLTREIMIFADRSDISEELTRLESHFKQFSLHLKKTEPVGRTLDFLTQEINREFNTIGAKANDAEISQLVVVCKAEIEKIREQVQNIE